MTELRAIVGAMSLFFVMGTTQAQNTQYEAALNGWSRVLSRFVDADGRVDFRALAGDRADLDQFIEYIAGVSPGSHSDLFATPAQVLTYHINAYNALAMHGVIEEGIPAGFTSLFRRLIFFKFHRIVVGGTPTSLSDYENKVIRPLGEPRVHFALNCMVRDCPRLPREPFRAEMLDSQLAAAAREFFSKVKHIRVDIDERELWLSEILDFYTEDFVLGGKRQGLISYVNQYLSTPIDDDYQVRFIPYDWTINQSSVQK